MEFLPRYLTKIAQSGSNAIFLLKSFNRLAGDCAKVAGEKVDRIADFFGQKGLEVFDIVTFETEV
mgnify:CR=1 FL=1